MVCPYGYTILLTGDDSLHMTTTRSTTTMMVYVYLSLDLGLGCVKYYF